MQPLKSSFDQETSAALKAVDELMVSLLTCQLSNSSRGAVYQLASGGKRTRAILALFCSRHLDLDYESSVSLAALCELLHNASLIHDDIQDHTEMRRGKPSVWKKYGTDVAICSGDLMISAAFASTARINSLYSSLALTHIHSIISEVICGQALDLSLRNKSNISPDEYIDIVEKKTGALLGLPIELAFIYSGKAEFISLIKQCVRAFALAYQIYDDIEDSKDDEFEGNLNIINIMIEKSTSAVAIKEAKNLAANSMTISRNLAKKIPYGCGDILLELSKHVSHAKTPHNAISMETNTLSASIHSH